MVYYTYAYLREDRSPYYIGKGKGNRAYREYRRIRPPKDKSRILILKQNLTEAEAYKHEIYMINVFGRIDLGTGILRNLTNGGEGGSGAVVSEEHKRKMSESKKGEKNPQYGKPSWNKDKPLSEEHRRKLKESHAKYHYIIYSITEDKTYETNTLKGFCEEHSLYRSPLTNTYTGKGNYHKGFKLIKKERLILS
jgi:hypothetical protein